LEKTRADVDAAVRSTQAGAHGEIDQLKKTVASLRERLELQQLDRDNAVRQAHSQFADENAQLHATIAALRDQLENAHRETR